MKKSFLVVALFLSSLMNNTITYALNEDHAEYHCPSIHDIKYERGTFTAETSYNGVNMRWYTIQTYPEANATIKKFNFTNTWNGCVGGMCTIYCVYEVESRGDHLLKFSVSRDEYRLVSPMKGPWTDGFCEANMPEECTFSVAENHW